MSGAIWVEGAPAKTYGDLNVHGMPAVAAVLHTTETSGMPGYSNGDVAPHETYDPLTRTFYRHAPWDLYVGTMRGHSYGGHTNCKAIQLEIICYSDRSVADQSASRLWVGDLAPEHYDDLAEWFDRVQDETDVGGDVTPTPEGGWLYGTGSPDRMSDAEWDPFSGLTAHGAVPHQSHWDTGVLDLVAVATGGSYVPPPTQPDPDSFEIAVRRILVSQSVNDYEPEVGIAQGLLITHGYSLERHGVDSVFGPETRGRVEAFQRDHALEPDGAVGEKTWTQLEGIPQ